MYLRSTFKDEKCTNASFPSTAGMCTFHKLIKGTIKHIKKFIIFVLMCHFYRIIYNSGINKSILLSENSSLNFLRLLPDVLASDLTSIENRSSAIEKIQSHCSYFFSPPTLRKLLKSFTTSRTHQTSVSNAPASYRLIRIIPIGIARIIPTTLPTL